MTLLELLLVMFLLALVLGVGLGALSELDLARSQAAGLVKNVLQSAQNTALASHAPARVRVDPATGRIQAESALVVATYTFEGGGLTGFGPDGEVDPEDLEPRGFVGACFAPRGRPKVTARIPLERDPGCDFTLGFVVRVAVLRETAGAGRVFSLGGAEAPTLALELGTSGALRGRFRTRVGERGSDRPGEMVVLTSPGGLVPVGRWVELEMRYDRAQFELLVDGVVVAAQPEEAFVWRTSEELVLSDDALPFPGLIDSLSLSAQVEGEPGILPASVTFAPDSARAVRFAAGGGLDRAVHADVPRIGLLFEDGERRDVSVGLFGTVQ
jgi:type II secretory pathway pseudopilin PulG